MQERCGTRGGGLPWGRNKKGRLQRVAVDVDPYRIYFKYKKAVFEGESGLPPSKPMTLTPPSGREVIKPSGMSVSVEGILLKQEDEKAVPCG